VFDDEVDRGIDATQRAHWRKPRQGVIELFGFRYAARAVDTPQYRIELTQFVTSVVIGRDSFP
jgi:hypothetical protein